MQQNNPHPTSLASLRVGERVVVHGDSLREVVMVGDNLDGSRGVKLRLVRFDGTLDDRSSAAHWWTQVELVKAGARRAS